MDPHPPNMQFGMSSDYRRPAMYAVGGLTLALAFATHTAIKAPEIWRVVGAGILGVLWLVSLFAIIWVFRWGFRIGADGVARRHLISWRVWPWDDFRAGAVRKGPRYASFLDTRRPPESNTLTFSCASSGDQETILQTVERIWKPPVPAEVPDDCILTTAAGEAVHMYPRGIKYSAGAGAVDYTWSHVKEIHVVRRGHDHLDFLRLDLDMHDRVIHLRCPVIFRHSRPDFTGASPEAVLAHLEKHVRPEQLLMVALNGQPRGTREVRERTNMAARKRRICERCLLATGLAWLGSIGAIIAGFRMSFTAENRGILLEMGVATMCWLVVAAVLKTQMDRMRGEVMLLDEWKATSSTDARRKF